MIPMYFMIALWGGPNRVHAAIKFLLFSLTGACFCSLGFWPCTTSWGHIRHAGSDGGVCAEGPVLDLPAVVPRFAIKVPMLPVHMLDRRRSWRGAGCGSRHSFRAPAEDGAYGLIRFCLSDALEASFASLIQWLSVLAILYGGILAMAQSAIKRFIRLFLRRAYGGSSPWESLG